MALSWRDLQVASSIVRMKIIWNGGIKATKALLVLLQILH